MSVISCIALLLPLLCMDTFHTCNARSLVGAISKEHNEKMLPLPTKRAVVLFRFRRIMCQYYNPRKYLYGSIVILTQAKEIIPEEQDDNKVGHVKQSISTKSNMKEPIEDSMVKQSRVEKSDKKSRDSKTNNVKGREAKHSNSEQGDHGSLVSISWRVPRNKMGEKQPGFNLDYSPPREHPGHHN